MLEAFAKSYWAPDLVKETRLVYWIGYAYHWNVAR